MTYAPQLSAKSLTQMTDASLNECSEKWSCAQVVAMSRRNEVEEIYISLTKALKQRGVDCWLELTATATPHNERFNYTREAQSKNTLLSCKTNRGNDWSKLNAKIPKFRSSLTEAVTNVSARKCINLLGSIPKGTKITCSNGIFVGSMCSYSCDSGYALLGEQAVYCQGSTKWTSQRKLPKCKESEVTEKPTEKTPEKVEETCKKKFAVHDLCCGKVSYNSQKARCCNGKVSTAWPVMTECCGPKAYNPDKMGCCSEKLFKKNSHKCEDGKVVRK